MLFAARASHGMLFAARASHAVLLTPPENRTQCLSRHYAANASPFCRKRRSVLHGIPLAAFSGDFASRGVLFETRASCGMLYAPRQSHGISPAPHGMIDAARRRDSPPCPRRTFCLLSGFRPFRSQREMGPETAPSGAALRLRALQGPQSRIGQISHPKLTKLKIFNTFDGCGADDTRPHCQYQPLFSPRQPLIPVYPPSIRL